MMRQATLADAVEYFGDRNLTVGESFCLPCYVIDEAVLFTVDDHGNGEVEAHICIRRKDARHSRQLAKKVADALFAVGYTAIRTSIGAEYKTANNMAAKLGFELIGCYNGENHYILRGC